MQSDVDRTGSAERLQSEAAYSHGAQNSLDTGYGSRANNENPFPTSCHCKCHIRGSPSMTLMTMVRCCYSRAGSCEWLSCKATKPAAAIELDRQAAEPSDAALSSPRQAAVAAAAVTKAVVDAARFDVLVLVAAAAAAAVEAAAARAIAVLAAAVPGAAAAGAGQSPWPAAAALRRPTQTARHYGAEAAAAPLPCAAGIVVACTPAAARTPPGSSPSLAPWRLPWQPKSRDRQESRRWASPRCAQHTHRHQAQTLLSSQR